MILNYSSFINSLIVESLHPELQALVQHPNLTNKKKQTLISNKIKDLTTRGEYTGIEGNMPAGSSRAYLKHADPENIMLDGKPTSIKTGTKVAIRAILDAHHRKHNFDDLSLGALQNRAENDDHWVNSTYRILMKNDDNTFTTNKEGGIFPPLIDHDDKNHEWSHVGNARDITHKEFRELTKNPDFPNGVTHKDFVNTLVRHYNVNNGKYWIGQPSDETHMDKVGTHPLLQKFMDYHGNTGHPPHDYSQLKNMGVFEHPDGSRHIVARDHGFDTEVANAYSQARKNKFGMN